MFDTTKLERLAVFLHRAADVAEAKARQHTEAREPRLAELESRRALRCQDFSETLNEAISELKRPRARNEPFKAPTWEQVKAFAVKAGWPEPDARSWFNHFKSCGWIIGKNKPMKDWLCAAENGFKRWQKDKAPRGNGQRVIAELDKGDPQKWEAFLIFRKIGYTEFRYAMDYLKTDFRKWLKEANAGSQP